MVASTQLTEATAQELLAAFRGESGKLLARFRIPPQDGEDLIQDTIMLFLRLRPETPSPEGWLQSALKFRCLVYWRERRREFYRLMDTALIDALAEPTAPSQEHRVFLDQVLRRLRNLPEHCWAILSLRYQSDARPAELAERLGYSRSGIYKTIERCLAALSRQLTVAPRRRA